MKKFFSLIALTLLLTLVMFPACRSGVNGEHTPVPVKEVFPSLTGPQAPDDIMPVPGGGPAYIANVHQQGEENPWPPIEIVEVSLGSGSNEAHVYYRNDIETRAGETRNNVIKVIIPGKEVKTLSMYADNVPDGITLIDGMQWSGHSSRASVLVIEISPDATPGQYHLEIGLEINGRDYGEIPCKIDVVDSGETDYSGLGLTEEEIRVLEERGGANVDSAEVASKIAGFKIAVPSYLPEGFSSGKYMVQLSGGRLPEELKPKFNNTQVHQVFTWQEDHEVMIYLIHAVHKSGLGGGEPAEICGHPGEKSFTEADPKNGRPYAALSFAWGADGRYYILTSTLGGPLDEATLEKIACSLRVD